MAEPTSALSFEDLVVRVAELLEIADWDATDGNPIVPVSDNTNRYNMSLCVRIANNAIRMFIADAPPKGWRWMKRIHSLTQAVTYTGTATAGTAASLTDSDLASTYADDFFNGYSIYITAGTGVGESATITDYTGLTGVFAFTALSGASTPDTTSKYTIAKSTLAIDGDGSRYLLPEDFGGTVDGKITYAANSAHGTQIEWADESQIRDYRSNDIQSGYSTLAATRPYSPTSPTIATNRRWEIIFDPQPASIQTVKFPYTMHFNKLQLTGGAATNGAAAAISDSSLANLYPNDLYNGWRVSVISGTGKGATALVTDFVGADGEFFVTDWLYSDGTAAAVNPAAGSLYTLQPAANVHPAGFMFDNAIEAACKARAQMETGDIGDNWIQEYRQVALPEAWRLDSRSAPRRLGPLVNGPRTRRHREFDSVTTDNDE